MPDIKYGQKWSTDETIIAFYYYCKIPFGTIHKTNPEIIRIASLLGRTPSALVLKMGNLAHFDPEIRKRNINGLQNASKLDSEIVERFYADWEELTFQAETIEASLTSQEDKTQLPVGSTRLQEVKARVNQDFFRESVLASYHSRCCITGMNNSQLLIASHIKPWKDSDPRKERANPSNGLCLNALHDKAFDKGLITVLPDYTVRVSSKLKDGENEASISWIVQCDKQPIHLPEKFMPQREYLEYHNDMVFIP